MNFSTEIYKMYQQREAVSQEIVWLRDKGLDTTFNEGWLTVIDEYIEKFQKGIMP